MSKHGSIVIHLLENQNKINKTMQLTLNSNIYKENNLIKYAKFAQL